LTVNRRQIDPVDRHALALLRGGDRPLAAVRFGQGWEHEAATPAATGRRWLTPSSPTSSITAPTPPSPSSSPTAKPKTSPTTSAAASPPSACSPARD
jgi:hypothetical protein